MAESDTAVMTAPDEKDPIRGAAAATDPDTGLDTVLQLAVLELPLIAASMQVDSLGERGMPEGDAQRVYTALRRVFLDDQPLRERAVSAFTAEDWTPDPDRQAAALCGLREELRSRASADAELRELLGDAFAGRGGPPPDRPPTARPPMPPAGRGHRLASRLRTSLHISLMLVVFVLVLVGPSMAALLTRDEGLRWALLRVFAVIVLAGFPGFLLARFVFSRARTVWDEFVLNLHRLRLDEPRYLPEPLLTSPYHRAWYEEGGPALRWSDSIYKRKFQAAYGAIPQDDNATAMLTLGKALPAYLTTLVLAVLWTAVLWGAAPLTLHPDDLPTLTALVFAFLGAYAFSVEMLIRRYFQLDLRPIAYSGILARLFFVVVAGYAIHHAFGPDWSSGTEAAMLFVVGFFPTTALQLLRVAVAGVLRTVRLPNLASDYPLNDLDGMNVWYEARMLEVGIEDLQNLASANIVDVMLNTRVPVARFVDWLDQAILYLHMAPVRGLISRDPPAPPGQRPPGRAVQARYILRSHGIRTATDLEDQHDARTPGLSRLLGCDDGVSVVRAIYASFEHEPNLDHVRSWKGCAVPGAAKPRRRWAEQDAE